MDSLGDLVSSEPQARHLLPPKASPSTHGQVSCEYLRLVMSQMEHPSSPRLPPPRVPFLGAFSLSTQSHNPSIISPLHSSVPMFICTRLFSNSASVAQAQCPPFFSGPLLQSVSPAYVLRLPRAPSYMQPWPRPSAANPEFPPPPIQTPVS